MLCLAVLGLFLRMPSNRGGIKQDFSALHGRQAGALGIPLVPANEHADLAVAGVPGTKAKVARREIELLVVKRIIRNVHLAVDAEERAVGINDGSGIMVNSGASLLEKRGHDHDGI